MKNLNLVLLSGALVQKPDLSFTTKGTAVCVFTVGGSALSRGGREVKFFIRAEVLGGTAEQIADLEPGAAVVVEGALRLDRWQDRESGLDRQALRVKAYRAFPAAGYETAPTSNGGVTALGGVNQVMVNGRLTKDAELRYTPDGKAVATLSLAVSDGEPDSLPHYVDVTVWEAAAEAYADVVKGTLIQVIGRLENASWTAANGSKRSALRIVADEIVVVLSGAARAKPEAKPEGETKASASAVKPASRRAATSVRASPGRGRASVPAESDPF